MIWGHSHRAGPWPADDAAEWVTPGGTRILNTGSWVYQRHFLSEAPGDSPYWPGTAVVLDDGEPPAAGQAAGGALAPGAGTPGVKQVTWHSSPSPIASSSTPAVWCGCVEERVAARPVDRRSARPFTDTVAGARQHRPHAARLVRAGVGAGLVGGLGGQQQARLVLGARRGATGSRSTPSSAWISRSVSA